VRINGASNEKGQNFQRNEGQDQMGGEQEEVHESGVESSRENVLWTGRSNTVSHGATFTPEKGVPGR